MKATPTQQHKKTEKANACTEIYLTKVQSMWAISGTTCSWQHLSSECTTLIARYSTCHTWRRFFTYRLWCNLWAIFSMCHSDVE